MQIKTRTEQAVSIHYSRFHTAIRWRGEQFRLGTIERTL